MGGALTAHGLIDTTEMYLRTIYELEEEGIVPLRARIAERLTQSGPTVSQTVGDAGAQGHHAFFFELVDRAEVHLGGVDELVHAAIPFTSAPS